MAAIPRNLPALVKGAFESARNAGSLVFYPTRVALLMASGVPFQLRFSPALAAKPVHPQRHDAQPDEKKAAPPKNNPFENPDPALLVATFASDLSRYNIVLNKFAIVPEHFILATAQFAPQTHVLDRDDLAATYACIKTYAASSPPQELFAFFNSGPHSGASQPHRHIQLLPVERMRDGLEEEWGVLADKLGEVDLEFETFSSQIGEDTTSGELHETYISLLHRSMLSVARFRGEDDPPAPKPGEEAPVSYNLAMTQRSLVLCPRLSEGAVLTTTDPDGEPTVLATLGVNGAVLAGTALVKSEREWDALRADGGAVGRILGGIGVPRCRM